MKNSITSTLFVFCQYIIPQRLLSSAAGWLAECRWPWVKNTFIDWFIKRYEVDMSIALDPDPSSYQHFNDFFTRSLASGERPIVADTNAIACPADGCISQLGDIKHGRVFQAKGQEYSLLELLGGDPKHAKVFQNGRFATVYLSPKDYHRVHMPLAGTLETMIHVPGELFSVNETTADNVPRLFARNERVVCLFDTSAGPMAVILVGAMIVASIETSWAGLVTPLKRQIRRWDYANKDGEKEGIYLDKGEEMGRFKLGSTAIVLFGDDCAEWQESLEAQSPVKMGEAFGNITQSEQ